MYKVDFVGACSECASGLFLAAEQSIGWGQEAWIGCLYKMDFVGAFLERASGLSLAAQHKLQFHKLTSGDKKFGSATIHVVSSLAQPSYVMGHILKEPQP